METGLQLLLLLMVLYMVGVGSPFHPAVVNPNRVQLVGGCKSVLDPDSNSITLRLHEPFSLEFSTRAAGPGLHFICLMYATLLF